MPPPLQSISARARLERARNPLIHSQQAVRRPSAAASGTSGDVEPVGCGGGRAGDVAGPAVGSPTWARILVTTGAFSMVAMKRRRPPQPAHASTSIANTRRIRSARAQARRVRLALGDGGEVGYAGIRGSRLDLGGGLAVGGGDDGSITAVVTGTVGRDGVHEGTRVLMPVPMPSTAGSAARYR